MIRAWLDPCVTIRGSYSALWAFLVCGEREEDEDSRELVSSSKIADYPALN